MSLFPEGFFYKNYVAYVKSSSMFVISFHHKFDYKYNAMVSPD